MIAGKTAPDSRAKITIGAFLPLIVAGRYGDDFFEAGIAVVANTFVPIPRRKKNDTAFTVASLADRKLHRQAGRVGERHDLIVDRVIRIGPIPVSRSPTAGDHIGPILGGPDKSVRFRLRPQIRGQT